MTSVPAADHPHFDDWALAQLRLYKPHRSIHELCTPTVRSVFDAHVALGGFPNVAPDDGAVFTRKLNHLLLLHTENHEYHCR
jgi:hypothetical protein